MNLETRIIWLYLCIDEAFKSVCCGERLRKAGFSPRLSDIEVLVIVKDCDLALFMGIARLKNDLLGAKRLYFDAIRWPYY